MRDAGHRTPDAGHRTSDNGHRTSDGEKSKNNISTPQGGGHNNGMQPFALFLVGHGFAFKTILHGRKVKLEDRSQKKKIMFLHSKNKASRKGYKGIKKMLRF